MPKSKHLRRRRIELWNADPRCFYCRKVTILDQCGDHLHPNAATIEHLRSRYQPERQVPPRNNEPRYVLSCWKCNNEANRVEQASIPREELNRRADSYPREATPAEASVPLPASRPRP